MSENTDQAAETGDHADTAAPGEQAGYDAGSDSDADPGMMNPRDLTGAGSGEDDPDADPDSLNPRGDA